MKKKVIIFKDVSKKYVIKHEKPTFIEYLFGKNKESFLALKKINFTVFQGQRVGIVGPNGAGKTTLLKMISGICSPSSGKIIVLGKVISLIDVDAGFHPELSGYDNIFLNGLLLGKTKKELQSRLQEIITFADIGKFIDAPLYTYSEGMKLRLGFSIAVFSQPDILILDESMSVGDKDFQMKSKRKIKELFSQGITVVMVSHWLKLIRQSCDCFYLMKNGRIEQIVNLDEYEKGRAVG